MTTPGMADLIAKAGPIMAALVAEHNDNQHAERPRTGCPGCLLSERKVRQ